MSTQVHSEHWTADGSDLLSRPLLNFFARRRIAISLIGFVSLMLFNLLIRGTVPLNPFAWNNPPVLYAWMLLVGGLAIRSWSAGSLNKSREVSDLGPYSMTRNPLYIGSFLMMFGFCLLLRDLPSFIFACGPMAFLYWLQIQFEEKRLLFLFPDLWTSYAARVPRFIPRRIPSQALQGWTRAEWIRNREWKTLLASLAGVLAVFLWRLFRSLVG